MKKIIILIMFMLLLSFNGNAAQTQCGNMSVNVTRQNNKYRADVYWRSRRIASYNFNCKPQIKFVYTDKLTYKMLSARKNKVLYIECFMGQQLNAKGEGKIYTTKSYNYYISYKNLGFKSGDKIRTYCIYNPYNNYEDDVVKRCDEKIK